MLDHWIQRHLGVAFDDGGRWAASGQVNGPLLAALRADAFFAAAPPKSTGRDLFEPGWLQTHLGTVPALHPADVQATLLELTAGTAVDALRLHAADTRVLRVCGGGARNGQLMRRLKALLAGVDVQDTAVDGVAPDHVEALAFAWLARAFIARDAGNLPAVTGAAGPRVLGALYPA